MCTTEMKHHVAHVAYDIAYNDAIREGIPHRDTR